MEQSVASSAVRGKAAIGSREQRAQGLSAILKPRSIAVIGATERVGSVGAAVMRNLVDGGFSGSLAPINLTRDTVFGIPAYRSIGAVPRRVDLAVVCTPAHTVPGLMGECGAAGVRGMVIISAGFRETGDAGRTLEQAIRNECDRFPQMRVIGPNSVGLIVPSLNVNASFARTSPKPGGVALLSQSGALGAAILGWARDEDIGFSHFISVGNMVDVGFGELLDAMADDAMTTSVVLYIEAITDAARFVQAALRCTACKPVIAYKAGRSAVAAKAAESHTGALAGEDAIYQAAFEECGVIRVNRLEDLLSTAELLGRGRWPNGPRLGIVTNAGGPGVIAADALIAGSGTLAQLSSGTKVVLNALLPPCWSHGNPVDVIGDAPPERLASALDAVIKDDNVDAALVIVTPQAMIDVSEAARAVAQISTHTAKLILAAWMGGLPAQEGVAVLQAAGIPTYATPEQAVEAFLHLAAHARHLSKRTAEPLEVPVTSEVERPRMRQAATELTRERSGALSEVDAKSLFSIYGIPVTQAVVGRSREQAIAAARSVGYPVVLKVVSPQITHKTDVDGVRLDLRTDNEVAEAFETIARSLGSRRRDAQFEGVTVQRMVDRSSGLELIVGAKRDATFGPVVLAGAGGIAAEVMNDRAIGLAPVTIERAREMMKSLRLWPLLQNFRGRGSLNTDAVARVIVQMSQLISDVPGISEAECNPILVTPKGVIALDARVITKAMNGTSVPTARHG